MISLADKLDGLAAMPPAALRAEWRRVYREPAPGLGIDLLARGIAWRLQVNQQGGLATAVERELVKLAGHVTSIPQTSVPAPVSLRAGTKLVRSWNGETYTVLVTNDGYRFKDQTFRSLSSIAHVITGTKWSGPRFFGVKGSASAKGGRNA